jgi:hypothetical protein
MELVVGREIHIMERVAMKRALLMNLLEEIHSIQTGMWVVFLMVAHLSGLVLL